MQQPQSNKITILYLFSPIPLSQSDCPPGWFMRRHDRPPRKFGGEVPCASVNHSPVCDGRQRRKARLGSWNPPLDRGYNRRYNRHHTLVSSSGARRSARGRPSLVNPGGSVTLVWMVLGRRGTAQGQPNTANLWLSLLPRAGKKFGRCLIPRCYPRKPYPRTANFDYMLGKTPSSSPLTSAAYPEPRRLPWIRKGN